ncbi:MAG: penicillin acylase family protein [Ignavibacteria bacterium]|nr:penicillin acylase family protein [Ignavibacteria bacterium]
MTRRAGLFAGAAGLVLVVCIGAFLFFRYQVTKSFPETSGTLVLPSLDSSVTVDRDQFGVPLITASSEHDLLVATGFVHAQDRLWQMDISRRAGEGRLSEVFGEVTVPYDRMFRIVGIRRAAEQVERVLSPSSRQRLEWYAEGVNLCIQTQAGKLPLEFDFLQYEPERWTVTHSLIVAQMMAWELNLSWWTDLTFGTIAGTVDSVRASHILPGYPERIKPIVDGRSGDAGRALLALSNEYRRFRGYGGIGGGSNAWVIAPGKSASGHVILANDTHLHLQLPSKWHEMHLRIPGHQSGGMSIPGTPGIVSGQNGRIAWGVTNMMADESDFYIVRVDTADSTRYWHDGALRSMEQRTEEILVDGADPVPVTIRSTHHGPIVSDIVYPLRRSDLPFVAAMRWTGYEPADRVEAFHRINNASNWAEFLEGVEAFPGPGQNFVYGDMEGNIGYASGGLIPIRGKGNSLLPLPGWTSSADWRGYVPARRMPRLFNPPEGFVATANNRIADRSFPYHISDLWEPPARIQRLRELLSEQILFSVHDFELMQNDMFSHHARELVPYFLEAWEDTLLGFPDEERIRGYFRNWDFTFSQEDRATALFQQTFVRLLTNLYGDELGPDLLHDFVMLGNIPIRVTQALVESGRSPWFDDTGTPEVENRKEILCRSLAEAVSLLTERFGPDTRFWRWGAMHELTLKHPFGLVSPLQSVFNVGPFPLGGGPTTLMSAEYSFNEPFAVTVAGSFRMVYDFAVPEDLRVVLPSGQSGQAFHPNYSDQTPLWVNGAYRTFRHGGSAGRGGETLVLTPH